MEAYPERPRTTKEKLLTGAMISVAAISLFVASGCKVILPNGKVMSRSAYLKKRAQARKKCNKLLPDPLKNKKFDDIYCHPCAKEFRTCIDSEF
jgi:hypothetical protein